MSYDNQPFDLFMYLSNNLKALPCIIIFNYVSIQYLLKCYISYYSRNINYNSHILLSDNLIPTFNSITFKSKLNTFIYSLPSELTRNHYGYSSNNIYDRILKFGHFMTQFLQDYNKIYFSNKLRHDIHVPKLQQIFDLFDYIDLDMIISQCLNINIRKNIINEMDDEMDEDSDELDEEFSVDHYNLNRNDKSNNKLKKNNKSYKIIDHQFKYSQVYNLDSINRIISIIVDLFQLDGYSMTDYNLKSITLNVLTKTDYMILFNYNYIVDLNI